MMESSVLIFKCFAECYKLSSNARPDNQKSRLCLWGLRQTHCFKNLEKRSGASHLCRQRVASDTTSFETSDVAE